MSIEEKYTSIVPAGTPNEEDFVVDQVPVRPGDTAADIIRMLGRSPEEFFLGTLGGRIFRPTDIVYPHMKDGETLAISPHMEAGLRLFGGSKKEAGASAPVVRKLPASGSTVANAPGQALAHFKGWGEKGPGVFSGVLATGFGPLKARIRFSGGEFLHMEIHEPPREIWQAGHPHQICFFPRKGGWQQLHMQDTPHTVDAAILNAERTIIEAYRILHGGDQAPRFRAEIEAKARRGASR